MKKLMVPTLAAAFATAFAFAGPADDAAAAAKKIADASNYSWTQTSEMANAQFTPGPVQGQTEKDGYTVITREFNGNTSQTVRKGDQFAMQGQDGAWMNQEEMRAQFANRGGGGGGGAGGGAGRGGRGGAGGFGGGQVLPADEAATLAGKIKDAKLVDGAIVGTLSADDVAPMLTFGGRGGRGGGGGGNPPPAPKNASGTVKYWVKDGALVKYSVNVKGTVTGRNGEMEVDRTTTTEFKNVGSTKVTVPDEAKKKLGA